MELMKAIDERHSVRGFLDKKVDIEVIKKVMSAAPCAPSWASTRPWQYYVATGEALEQIRREYTALHAAGTPSENDIPCNPSWPKRELENTMEWGRNRNKIQWNIDPNDPKDKERFEAQKAQLQINTNRLFGAPVLIIGCMDKGIHNWGLYDMGSAAMLFLLAAHEQGLGVITSYHLARYPKILRKVLHIPDDLDIVIGYAMGYKDENNVENKYESLRTPLSEMCTFVD